MELCDEKDLPEYIDRLIHDFKRSSSNYDPYEYIYDWLENEEDYLSSDHIEQFVWQESREMAGTGTV